MRLATGWYRARFHVLAIVLVYALVIPVARLDQRDLRGSGSGWILLDMRGLYVAGYLIAAGLVVTILLLHLSVKQLRKPFSFGLVMACLFAPTVMVPVGGALYGGYVRAADEHRAQAIATTAEALADSMLLRWSMPAGSVPPRFELELTSGIAAEVLHVSVSGSAASQHGSFISSTVGQTPLTARLQPGVPYRVSLVLDHEPTPDTYFSVYCSLAANEVVVSVGWIDPNESSFGTDAVRRIPLH